MVLMVLGIEPFQWMHLNYVMEHDPHRCTTQFSFINNLQAVLLLLVPLIRHENFVISKNFMSHSVDFQDLLRHFCPFLHIFRKHLKIHSHACLNTFSLLP